MKFQKGQSIVEFSLILPLFLLFFLGIIYFGSYFSDYLTLSTIARNSAREAAVVSVIEENQLQPAYEEVRKHYATQILPSDMYKWDPKSTDYFKIKPDENYDNVVVEIKAGLNPDGIFLGDIIDKLTGNTETGASKLDINITYTMPSEFKHNKT